MPFRTFSSFARFTDTTLTLLRFQQFVVQGLWGKASPLQQLSASLTEDEIKTISAAFPKKDGTLRDFLLLPEAERKKLVQGSSERLKGASGASAVTDLLKTANLLPNVVISLDHYVEEEASNAFDLLDDETRDKLVSKHKADNASASSSSGGSGNNNEGSSNGESFGKRIHEHDLVTLKVTMKRMHGVKVGSTPPKGSAHKVLAPHFPRRLSEAWWLILIGDVDGRPQIHAIERVTEQGEVVEHKLRFMCAYRYVMIF